MSDIEFDKLLDSTFFNEKTRKEAIRVAHQSAILQAERRTLQSVLDAVADMEKAYPEVGRKVSRGEIIKWVESELGTGVGRHG